MANSDGNGGVTLDGCNTQLIACVKEGKNGAISAVGAEITATSTGLMSMATLEVGFSTPEFDFYCEAA